MEQLGGTLGLGYVLYGGGRDELNKKCRDRDDEIDRLRLRIKELEATHNDYIVILKNYFRKK